MTLALTSVFVVISLCASLDKWMAKICDLFPGKFSTICVYFVDTYGMEVIKLFEQGFTVPALIAACSPPPLLIASCHCLG